MSKIVNYCVYKIFLVNLQYNLALPGIPCTFIVIIICHQIRGGKSHLRNNLPVIIAPSTNNGLGANATNIAKLLNTKNYYFVPFRQDNPITKPRSIVFDSEYILKTIKSALNNEQIQPILL